MDERGGYAAQVWGVLAYVPMAAVLVVALVEGRGSCGDFICIAPSVALYFLGAPITLGCSLVGMLVGQYHRDRAVGELRRRRAARGIRVCASAMVALVLIYVGGEVLLS